MSDNDDSECIVCFEDLHSQASNTWSCGHSIHILCQHKTGKPQCVICRKDLTDELTDHDLDQIESYAHKYRIDERDATSEYQFVFEGIQASDDITAIGILREMTNVVFGDSTANTDAGYPGSTVYMYEIPFIYSTRIGPAVMMNDLLYDAMGTPIRSIPHPPLRSIPRQSTNPVFARLHHLLDTRFSHFF